VRPNGIELGAGDGPRVDPGLEVRVEDVDAGEVLFLDLA
jgi:hypothetical protein